MSTTPANSPPRIERPRALLIYLCVASLGLAVGLFKALSMRDELIARYPRLEPPLFWVYFATLPLQLLGIVGLWRMRRWGLHLSLLLAAIVLAIDLAVGMAWQHPLAVALMAAFLLAAVLPRWSSLR